MQVKNTGRVHPSPPSYKDPNSVFKLFPVAILALASALPPHDQEVPLFQCGCFDCYTRFWHRWDSSPNRGLIRQVIEAFEDHLVQNETPKASRKKDKANEAILMAESEGLVEAETNAVATGKLEMEVVVAVAVGGVSHKGLGRKVLPDVVGLFNSRLWSLWGTNI